LKEELRMTIGIFMKLQRGAQKNDRNCMLKLVASKIDELIIQRGVYTFGGALSPIIRVLNI
jgi:hypothetical protein